MRAYLKAWCIALLVLFAYCALASQLDGRQASFEHCGKVQCA